MTDHAPSTVKDVTKQSIFRLDESVVNRIAAGEIIQRPANALKELLENSIDGKATSIEVVVADGGLKLLQVTDNGTGIHQADLAILCERFTTSKLREFGDLAKMETYGFRGEALASITHVARVMVTTKTAESECAYRANYIDGVLVPAKPGASPDPKPTAGNQGTQISVEGMFYNIPARKRALNKPNEEYAKILDVINKYAIHCEGVAFSCKKFGENLMSLSTTAKNTSVDNIRLVYGSSVANELLSIAHQDLKSDFRFRGLITSANYHVKKSICVIFVNNRLVEASAIRKCVENVYSTILPKGNHPFTYLSIHVDPARIDVNVHPTKREVNLIDEDTIAHVLSSTVQARLAETENTRTFTTKALSARQTFEGNVSTDKLRRNANIEIPSSSSSSIAIRTDPKQQTLSHMLRPSLIENQSPLIQDAQEMTGTTTRKERASIRLASVKELRAEVRMQIHEDLTAILSEHVFVGVVDLAGRLAVIQHLTRLYLVDYGAISAELFYQIGLSEFGNFGSIVLKPALKLVDLLKIAQHDQMKFAGSKENDAGTLEVDLMYKQLTGRREMLLEYFALEITEEGSLRTLPLLLSNHTPSIAKLPNFLYRLAHKVDWTSEKQCFQTFLFEMALFYVPEVYRSNSDILALQDSELHATDRAHTYSSRDKAEETAHKSCIENVIFPAFKKRLIATKKLAQDKRVLEISELSRLYKTFERC